MVSASSAQDAPPESSRPRFHSDYTVACICPMGVELASVEAMLDEIHDSLPTTREQNAYTLGQLGVHNIVVAVMPQIGNNAAATVATQLLNDFSSIRFGFLVGIGGVPGEEEEGEDDVRLGDIVVSQPSGNFGNVVQYDMGKALVEGKFERKGRLNKPPEVLSANVRKLDAQHRRKGHQISAYVTNMLEKNPKMKEEYGYPGAEHDQLFDREFIHRSDAICKACDRGRAVIRTARSNHEPRIHYGTIGSANEVIKDAGVRDALKEDMNILCTEMEAAGLMDSFPCLVIRGICDYADSHKNKRWQPYAAAAVAAYMKELLMLIPLQQVQQTLKARVAIETPYRLGLLLNGAPDIDPDLFVGRQTELGAMEAILKPEDASPEQRRLVLGSLGGIGKTQLAMTYAKRHRHSYDSIFWLNATSSKTLAASIHKLVQLTLKLDDLQNYDNDQLIAQMAWWFSQIENTRWLLIFDNYDEPDQYDITQYYPYASHGSIIVTTRLPDQVRGTQVKVSYLNDIKESLQILQTRSERENVYFDVAASRLAKRLHGLPLALATAGTFLRRNTISFQRYLEEYEKRWNVSPRTITTLPEYEARTLYTTWDLSFARLKQEDYEASQLLTLLAYFDSQDIWYGLIRSGLSKASIEWLSLVAGDDVEFASTMGRLVEYCFVEAHGETESFGLHACVHDWVFHSLNADIDAVKYWFAFDCITEMIEGENWDSFSNSRFQRLAGHGSRLSHQLFWQSGNLDHLSAEKIEGFMNIAEMLKEQICYDAAERMYQRALQGCEKALGPDHTSTLMTVNNLGLLYAGRGKLAEAEQMYLRALQGCKKALGPDHTSTLRTVNGLGSLYADQGKLAEAEQMYLRALQGKEKALGPDHTSTLATVNNLGGLYTDQGKLAEAEQMYQRALRGYERRLGAEQVKTHIPALDATENLADLHARLGKRVEAKLAYQYALSGAEILWGHSSPRCQAIITSLAAFSEDYK